MHSTGLRIKYLRLRQLLFCELFLHLFSLFIVKIPYPDEIRVFSDLYRQQGAIFDMVGCGLKIEQLIFRLDP